jgi:hypothetical protein
MMLGNRGETAQTFQETLDFLDRARPHQYIFSCLSIYPGTRDFDEAEKAGWLDREAYFSGDFQELKTPFDATEADTAIMNEWFYANMGLRDVYKESAADYEAILERLGDYHGAHMDLADAYYHDDRLDDAERHVRRAVGIARHRREPLRLHAKARGDLEGMMTLHRGAKKDLALRADPERAAARAVQANGAAAALDLRPNDFQPLDARCPTLPGLLPELRRWSAPPPHGGAGLYARRAWRQPHSLDGDAAQDRRADRLSILRDVRKRGRQ